MKIISSSRKEEVEAADTAPASAAVPCCTFPLLIKLVLGLLTGRQLQPGSPLMQSSISYVFPLKCHRAVFPFSLSSCRFFGVLTGWQLQPDSPELDQLTDLQVHCAILTLP